LPEVPMEHDNPNKCFGSLETTWEMKGAAFNNYGAVTNGFRVTERDEMTESGLRVKYMDRKMLFLVLHTL